MSEYKVDLRDVRFILKEQLRIQELTESAPYEDFTWDDFDMVVNECAKFATTVVHPLQEAVEKQHAALGENGRVTLPETFHSVFKKYSRGGWAGVGLSPELGGQGLPHTIAALCIDLFIGACPSFAFVPGLARAAGRVIEAAGTPEQVKVYCENMYNGTWGGTMCLTEPQAGSAVGDLRAGAIKQADGRYKITGSKIFISAGDQDVTENVIHLVLAKTPDAPPGIKGVSLFIVPFARLDGSGGNDVAVTALEDKMGLHGSPTTSLSFGDNDDCYGEIIGAEGEGIRHMFLMMNEARIAVGLQASGISNFAYQLALDYAKERVQGTDVASMKDPLAERVAIIKHPDVRRMLMTMKAYSEGTRALLLMTASFVDRQHTATDDRDRERYKHLVEILTPICKAYGSYRAFDVTDLAIMVHGGYGYIREYEVEGLLRDVKIAAIYEGTNGIQALDLLGRKVARKGGMMLMTFIGWMNEFIAAHKNSENEQLKALIGPVEAAKNTLATVSMELGQAGMKGDIYYPVLHASSYLEVFGDVVMARILVEQAAIATERMSKGDLTPGEQRFYAGKVTSARFFVNHLLPRIDGLVSSIRSDDRSALEMDF